MAHRARLLMPVVLLVLAPVMAVAQEPASTPLIPVAITVTPPAPVNEALPILINARNDLELLANSVLGTIRPVGWSGSLNTADPQLVVLIRLDLELLAGAFLGAEQRPEGWFGAVSSTAVAVARDIRHDLELLADTVIEPGIRPPGWSGSDPLMRCNRATQSLIALLERGGFVTTADPNSMQFCELAEIEASQYVEQTLLTATGLPVAPVPGVIEPGVVPLTATIRETLTGVAVFLDRSARTRAGVLPRGVAFTPVARSTRQFSNMMVIRGEGFEVFIDYTFTTVSLAEFEGLPDMDTLALNPHCNAPWCA